MFLLPVIGGQWNVMHNEEFTIMTSWEKADSTLTGVSFCSLSMGGGEYMNCSQKNSHLQKLND